MNPIARHDDHLARGNRTFEALRLVKQREPLQIGIIGLHIKANHRVCFIACGLVEEFLLLRGEQDPALPALQIAVPEMRSLHILMQSRDSPFGSIEDTGTGP